MTEYTFISDEVTRDNYANIVNYSNSTWFILCDTINNTIEYAKQMFKIAGIKKGNMITTFVEYDHNETVICDDDYIDR